MGDDENDPAGTTTLGLETAAAQILKRAVEMDNAKRKLEALSCYREGIDLLMSVLKGKLNLLALIKTPKTP